MAVERIRVYWAVNLGHLTIDVFNSMGPVLLTFLSVPLLLSNRQIGFALGLYQFLAAVTQPPFGWLADRVGSRWLGPGSVAWTAGCLVLGLWLAETTHNFTLFLLLFSLAAVGSGAFHPQGTMHASLALAGRTATTTAVFFLCGQGGLASGPALAGLFLDLTGTSGIYLLALFVLPATLYMGLAMRSARPEAPGSTDEGHTGELSLKEARWSPVILIALISGLRGWAFMGTAFFLPKLFQDLGWSATAYGGITGLFWLGSGITGILAGRVADRWGRRRVVFSTTMVGCVALYFLPTSAGWTAFLLAVCGGGFLGAPHSILIVLFQDLLPVRRGLASGIALGYLFGVGAVVGWCIGLLGDYWGLVPILQAGAAVGVLGGLLALFLPATRAVRAPQPAGAPA